MRVLAIAALATALALTAACNTVRGAGEDVKSVGTVFSDHPNGSK